MKTKHTAHAPGVVAAMLVALLAAGTARAADWQHTYEAGAVITGGNTKTQTINLKGHSEAAFDGWKETFDASAVNSRQGGATSAEKYDAALKTDYLLSERDYAFFRFGFESDRFTGFRRRFSETVGYGRILADTDTFDWKIEVGAGARQSKLIDNTSKNEAVLRAQTDLALQIGEHSKLTEALSTEGGKSGWTTRSETALLNQLSGSLSSKVSLTLTHNSKVPAGKKKLDTQLALNLVYSFSTK